MKLNAQEPTCLTIPNPPKSASLGQSTKSTTHESLLNKKNQPADRSPFCKDQRVNELALGGTEVPFLPPENEHASA